MKLSAFGGRPMAKDNTTYESLNVASGNLSSLLQKLQSLGISDYEQFVALGSNDQNRGRLKEFLSVDNEILIDLLKEGASHLETRSLDRISSSSKIEFPQGALPPRTDQELKIFEINLHPSSNDFNSRFTKARIEMIAGEVAMATSINFVRQLPTVRNQADRGTCVGFSVTCVNEFAHSLRQGFSVYPDLSEQHLYYETKQIDGNPNICGTWIDKAMSVVSNIGQCPETIWSYNPNPPCNQFGKPNNADYQAARYKNNFVILDGRNIDQLKSFLSQKQLIAFSIPIFDSWYRSGETARSGRIILPFPGEPSTGGHAMVLVGYQDDASTPGGGYFILRNSWGAQYWGYENIYAPGYGTIPYEFMRSYAWEAACIV